MTNSIDRDRRLLDRMAERLELFERGNLSLGVLIGDLEFRLSEVEAIDGTAGQELRRHWVVLEEVYAVALEMHGGKLDSESEGLVHSSSAALRTRVFELLDAVRSEAPETE